MGKAKILFADNDPEYLKARKEFLENEGFDVVTAANPLQARRLLQKGGIDVAILDTRLEEDGNEDDISGLLIAEEVAHHIPKIILTAYPSTEDAARVLSPKLEGLPAAVKFLVKQQGKQEKPEVLIQAIHEALQFGKRAFQQTVDNITKQLNEDYADARKEARIHYWSSLVVALLGIGLIFGGIFLTLRNSLEFPVGIASSIGGIVTEVVNYLFFRRVDVAHKRVDVYHGELLQMRSFESLLAACEEFHTLDDRETAKKQIVSSAAKIWFKMILTDKPEPEVP
jgi:CheY-like chemotaxis protein